MDLDRTCTRTVLALPWLLNGSLPAADRRGALEHLIHCRACREELARTRTTLALYRKSETVRPVRSANGLGALAATKVRRGRILRRLSWAAAIAVLVPFLGGVWAVRELQRERTPGPEAARATSSAKRTVREPQPIFKDGFDSGKLNGWQQQLQVRASELQFTYP